MYYTESYRYAIFAYDFNPEKGTISNRRIFIEIDPNTGGMPDGLTVDADGYIWSAECGSGKVIRYSPKGKVDYSITLPVPRVTSCTFGGEDYSTLYITTAREHMSQDQLSKWPLSGSLFACKPGVSGIPETPFKEK